MAPFFFGFFLRTNSCLNSPPVAQEDEQVFHADIATAVDISRTAATTTGEKGWRSASENTKKRAASSCAGGTPRSARSTSSVSRLPAEMRSSFPSWKIGPPRSEI